MKFRCLFHDFSSSFIPGHGPYSGSGNVILWNRGFRSWDGTCQIIFLFPFLFDSAVVLTLPRYSTVWGTHVTPLTPAGLEPPEVSPGRFGTRLKSRHRCTEPTRIVAGLVYWLDQTRSSCGITLAGVGPVRAVKARRGIPSRRNGMAGHR